MSKPASGRRNGSRHRCAGCGHPQREHRDTIGCTVPKCACSLYRSPEDPNPAGN